MKQDWSERYIFHIYMLGEVNAASQRLAQMSLASYTDSEENGADPKDTRVDVMDRLASGYNYVTVKGVG